jgi:tetratricopeptide (TPR) repeat protein
MLKEIFSINTKAKKLMFIMFLVALTGLIIAYFYYGSINNMEDPRILHIKKLHSSYNKFVLENNMTEVLTLLDSMDDEYAKIPHYSDSFERGVLQTDKSSVYLNIALYQITDEDEKIDYLEKAEECLNKSISYYDSWKRTYSELDSIHLKIKIISDFEDVKSDNVTKIVDKRIRDIDEALYDLDKRYSVTYTNLGIVMRHKFHQDSALMYYRKAVELWDDNHAAKSNLNVLLGKEPLKRGVLEKIFPKEKE